MDARNYRRVARLNFSLAPKITQSEPQLNHITTCLAPRPQLQLIPTPSAPFSLHPRSSLFSDPDLVESEPDSCVEQRNDMKKNRQVFSPSYLHLPHPHPQLTHPSSYPHSEHPL